MTEQAKIVTVLAAMAEAYNRPMTATALEMMADDLRELTYDQVKAAARTHRQGPRAAFFPMPGELLEAARGDSQAAATTALATLQGAIRDRGAYAPPEFEDPLITRAVLALGGWVEVCHTPQEILIPHFRKCYEPMHRSGMAAEILGTGGYLPEGRKAGEPVLLTEALTGLIGEAAA